MKLDLHAAYLQVFNRQAKTASLGVKQLKRLISSSVFLVLLLLLLTTQASAQVVSNVSVQVVSGNSIRIDYYLSSPSNQVFQVDIYASTDGGRNFFQTSSISGDVGHVSGPGWKSATWDVIKDVRQFVGSDCVFKVQASEVKSLGDVLGRFFGGSESTQSFVNGLCVYGGWQNTTFVSSAFSNSLANGTLTNAGGWNAGGRLISLPFLLDASFVSQTFRINGSRYPIIYQGFNVSANFTLLPLSDYFDLFGGAGYQISELSMKSETLESDAQTNGAFWIAGVQINITSTWRLGAQYSRSITSGDRNWRQLVVFAGFNFSTHGGTGK